MKLIACTCPAKDYRRVPRKRWMRLFSSRRLYRCLACDAVLFIPPLHAIGSPFGDTAAQGAGGGKAPEAPAGS